MNRERLSGSSS